MCVWCILPAFVSAQHTYPWYIHRAELFPRTEVIDSYTSQSGCWKSNLVLSSRMTLPAQSSACLWIEPSRPSWAECMHMTMRYKKRISREGAIKPGRRRSWACRKWSQSVQQYCSLRQRWQECKDKDVTICTGYFEVNLTSIGSDHFYTQSYCYAQNLHSQDITMKPNLMQK